MKQPCENSTNYINRKDRSSLNIQAVAHHKYCSIGVSLKWPGSVHDARIFSNSSINRKLRNSSISKCEKAIVQNEPPVPVCILGDPAYLLLPFLMKEFANGEKNQSEQFHGFRLSSARMVIECSFGRLKARFCCLRRDVDINLNDVTHVIHAYFILHNFCEIINESISQQEVQAIMKHDREFQPPKQSGYDVSTNATRGKKVRKTFA